MTSIPSTFHSHLLGAWDLLSYTATSLEDPSDVVYPLGSDCRGRATFTPDGYMSAHIQSRSLAPFAWGAKKTTAAELADAAAKTVTYSASYHLQVHSETKATIYYDVTMAIPTTWVGTTEVRELEFEIDEAGKRYLYLSPGTRQTGKVERKVVVKSMKAEPRDILSRL